MNDIASSFNSVELSQLALFSLFTRFVDTKILWYMGVPQFVCHDDTSLQWAIAELVGLNLDYWNRLAQRASQVGLLVPADLGYWSIDDRHRDELRRYLPRGKVQTRLRVRAFTESAALVANQSHDAQKTFDPHEFRRLILNEPNYLAALECATSNDWPKCALILLLALQHTHTETSQLARWSRLVTSVVPFFVNLKTDGPKRGRDLDWSVITSFRIGVLVRESRFAEARALQRKVIESLRSQSAPWLDGKMRLDAQGLNTIQRFAGEYSRAASLADQDGQLNEAYEYLQRALALLQYGTKESAAFILQQLAALCLKMGKQEEAQRWISRLRSFGLVGPNTLLTSADISLSKASALGRDKTHEEQRGTLLAEARCFVDEALALANRDDRALMARCYSALGRVQTDSDQLPDAQDSYQQALFFYQAMGNGVGAAHAEANIASLLEGRGFRREALAAAMRAQQLLETNPGAATDLLVQVRENIQKLSAAIKQTADSDAGATDKVRLRDEVIRGMIANIRQGDGRHYMISVVGYYIDGYPYPASGFGIDSNSNPELHATEDGFECFAYFPVRNIQPKTVEKYSIHKAQAGDAVHESVRVPVRVRAADIVAIALVLDSKQTTLFADRETSAMRHLAFMRETHIWFEQRNAQKDRE